MLAEIYGRGPIVCELNSIPAPFDFYMGGNIVDYDGESENRDHVVVLTGFGIDEKTGMKYWSGRNSWGTWWGEDGWFRMRRGADTLLIESGTCTWMLHMRDLECGGHPRAGAKQTLDDKLTCVHASAMAMTN